VCITPLHVDVLAAIKELERAKKLGLVGVMVNTLRRGCHNTCTALQWTPWTSKLKEGGTLSCAPSADTVAGNGPDGPLPTQSQQEPQALRQR